MKRQRDVSTVEDEIDLSRIFTGYECLGWNVVRCWRRWANGRESFQDMCVCGLETVQLRTAYGRIPRWLVVAPVLTWGPDVDYGDQVRHYVDGERPPWWPKVETTDPEPSVDTRRLS